MRHALPVLILLLATPAGAGAVQLQELLGGGASQEQAPKRDTVAAPLPIALTEVGTEGEALARRLGTIDRLLAPDPMVLRMERELASARDTLDALTTHTAEVLAPPTDRRDVMDGIQDWRRAQSALDADLGQLRTRLGGLGEAKANLDRWGRRWAATDSAAAASGAGPELLARIAQARAGIARTDSALTRRLDVLVSLEGEHAEASYRAAQAIAGLIQALDRLRAQALQRDAAPLWAIGLQTEAPGEINARVEREVRRVRGTVARFPGRMVLHLLGTALLIWLLTRASRAVARKEDRDAGAAAAARILGHPIAAACLVSFLLALWFYPAAPLAIYDLALILATLPLIILTPTILAPSLAGPVVGLAVVNLLARIDSALLGEGAPHRIMLLVIGVGGVIVIARALRRRALRQAVNSPRWGMALRRTGQVALGLMALGVLANVLGFLTLAELLGESVPLVFYLAVILAGLVRVLDGLFFLLLDGWGRRHLRSVQLHRAIPRRAGWMLLQAAGILVWLLSALWAFALLTPALGLLARVFGMGITLGELHISLGGVAVFLLVVWAAALGAKILGGFIEEDVLGRMHLERGVAPTIARLIRYLLIAIGVIVALAAAGVQLTSLAIVGGALGVGIGFGLQNIVANFVAGLVLAFERPVKVGDLIQLDTLTGTVRRIGLRASVVLTLDGSEVIVPNSDLVSSRVVNWTFTDPKRRMEIPVGVAYGSDARAVMQLVREAAVGHPDVLKSPPPQALFRGFGDSSLDFVLRAWTERFDQWFVVESDLLAEIHDRLNEAGIVIPFPQRDLHLKSISDLAAQHLASEGPPRRLTPPGDAEA